MCTSGYNTTTKTRSQSSSSSGTLWLSAVRSHSMAMERFSAQVFTNEFTNQTSTAYGFCIEISILDGWYDDNFSSYLNISAIWHTITKIYTDMHIGTDRCQYYNKEWAYIHRCRLILKSLLHIWRWTLTNCLCSTSLETKLVHMREVRFTSSSLWGWPGIHKGNLIFHHHFFFFFTPDSQVG